MSEENKTAIITINLNVDESMIADAVEKAKAEIESELNRDGYLIDADNTLFIHSPGYMHEIKRIVFNGTEIPLEGVTHINFSVLSGDRCELTVTRSPVIGAK